MLFFNGDDNNSTTDSFTHSFYWQDIQSLSWWLQIFHNYSLPIIDPVLVLPPPNSYGKALSLRAAIFAHHGAFKRSNRLNEVIRVDLDFLSILIRRDTPGLSKCTHQGKNRWAHKKKGVFSPDTNLTEILTLSPCNGWENTFLPFSPPSFGILLSETE